MKCECVTKQKSLFLSRLTIREMSARITKQITNVGALGHRAYIVFDDGSRVSIAIILSVISELKVCDVWVRDESDPLNHFESIMNCMISFRHGETAVINGVWDFGEFRGVNFRMLAGMLHNLYCFGEVADWIERAQLRQRVGEHLAHVDWDRFFAAAHNDDNDIAPRRLFPVEIHINPVSPDTFTVETESDLETQE